MNASAEAIKEAAKAVKMATKMMSKVSLRQSNSSMEYEDMKSDDIDRGKMDDQSVDLPFADSDFCWR